MPPRNIAIGSTETAMVEAIVALLHPYAEVVLHDVKRGRVAAIWNPFSKRKVGDSSLLGELPDHDHADSVIGPYEKVGTDGHRITSITIRVAEGRGLLCINLDRHPLDTAIDALSKFAAAIAPQPRELFEHDWREEISRIVDDWCRRHQRRREHLDRTERIALISELDNKGLFEMRSSSQFAAVALGISRSSFYSLLQEARS
jgi:D-arginine utilization repressor